jgi:PRTRC genetic system protein C
MSIQQGTVTRHFQSGSRIFPDPDPSMTTDEVRLFYSQLHPDLLNAQVEGGEFEGDVQVFQFVRPVGTKG